MAQYDSYRSKSSRNKQDRGGSEIARCSQSETLLYHQHLSRPDIPMPRVWKSAAGCIGLISHLRTHRVNRTRMTSSSTSKNLWSSSETMDEQHHMDRDQTDRFVIVDGTEIAILRPRCCDITNDVVHHSDQAFVLTECTFLCPLIYS